MWFPKPWGFTGRRLCTRSVPLKGVSLLWCRHDFGDSATREVKASTRAARLAIGLVSLPVSQPVLPFASHATFMPAVAPFWREPFFIISLMGLLALASALAASLLIDRAKRRRAEAERQRLVRLIEAQRQHLDDIVTTVPIIVWETWWEPDAATHRVDFVSRHVEKALGYSTEEWLSKANFWLSIVLEADREQAVHDASALFATGKGGVLPLRWLARDGRVVWVEAQLTLIYDDSGKTVGLRGMAMDVTERRRAEETLSESEARLAEVIDSTTDAIVSIDAGQRIVHFNAAAETIFGRTAREAIGQSIDLLVPERFRPTLKEHVTSVSRNGDGERAIGSLAPMFGLRADGDEFPIEASILQTDERDEKVALTLIVNDITDRERAAESLRESEDRYRDRIENSQDLICTHDLDGNILSANAIAARALGFDVGDYENKKSIRDVVAPEFRDQFDAYLTKIKSEGAASGLMVVETRTGERRIWEYHNTLRTEGVPSPIVRGMARDVTDRMRAEEALKVALAQVSELKDQLEAENIVLQEEIKLEHNFGEIVGNSDAIKYVLYKIEQVAPTDTAVLILGETGTGKELVARAIHNESSRRDRPLVKVNCAALPANLIESELFGHEKGAFTGAVARKLGRFEVAKGATVFLDEIGELPLELQAKLLRVLQEGEFERLGSSSTIKIDARIIAATNRNLKAEVQKGLFREDLWYRLNVFPITVPPLRLRMEDVPLLVDHFVRMFSKKVGKPITSISPGVMRPLQSYSWPGNIRELCNVIERAVVSSHGSVLRWSETLETTLQEDHTTADLRTLEQVDREYIIRILEQVAWRIEGPTGAARVLGLNPSTLRTRMARLGIQRRTAS